MRSFVKLLVGAAVGAGSAGLGVMALAQTQPDNTGTITIHDPAGPMPDASRLKVILSKDIKCSGKVGVSQTCYLYGDPSKPGPYTVMYKWYPGHFSKPHFHNVVRWGYVVSGTWWVSSNNTQDVRTTYPVHAGSVAIDEKNGIHWDGARVGEKGPAIIILSGVGPTTSTQVDANGKPISEHTLGPSTGKK